MIYQKVRSLSPINAEKYKLTSRDSITSIRKSKLYDCFSSLYWNPTFPLTTLAYVDVHFDPA